jgi:hypothetical protein
VIVFDPKKKIIHLFDPLSHQEGRPLPGHHQWTDELVRLATDLGDNWTAQDSSLRLQFDGHQCGIWCIIIVECVRQYMISQGAEDLRGFVASHIAQLAANGPSRSPLEKAIISHSTSQHQKSMLGDLSADTRKLTFLQLGGPTTCRSPGATEYLKAYGGSAYLMHVTEGPLTKEQAVEEQAHRERERRGEAGAARPERR